MLTLKAMQWNNCFSYGDDNCIRFDQEPLTQLTGPNGAGKTSIALLVQEVLYGKNNRNIKKQDIANNKSGKKGYDIQLDFEKDSDEYTVQLNRTSNLKYKFFKNGEDISSHTSLDTYKSVAEVIGIPDFKIFCQLIYQHSTDSLDFLTATDTNRKRFLINLLQLERYLEYHEHFKDKARILNSEINVLEGKIQTIEAWVEKHETMDFTKQELLPTPEVPQDWIVDHRKLKDTLEDINNINRKISNNNEYKKQLNELDSKYYLGSAPPLPNPGSNELRAQLRVLDGQYDSHQEKVRKIASLSSVCHECMQEVDEETKNDMIDNECALRDRVKEKIGKLWDKIPSVEEMEAEVKKYKTEKSEFERLNQLIDNSLPSNTWEKDKVERDMKLLKIKIDDKQREIKLAEEHNRKVSAHNSKIDVVKNQLKEMKEELYEKNIQLVEKENLAHILELLKKTFSTNGLVSYKIESSVKELEKRINEYLAELTYFQIYFKLSGEKLNIEIVDDLGNTFSISNLSSGERARVNISTILAIRSILSSLTATKINFLMLDEVINSIDEAGREKLAEILLKENLNTFIVSHGWEHPLIPRISIVKEHNISRIEYD